MKKQFIGVLFTILSIFLLTVAAVPAYTLGYLPGGTTLEVDNTEPEDGDVLYIPVGETSIDITDSGTVSLAEGVAIADTTVIYVLDASGSTADPSGGDICGEQQTHDPESAANEIIDCEICATRNLNSETVALGSIDEVAMILFAGSGLTADATPTGGDDPIIHPAADANGNGAMDVDEVLMSIKVAYLVGEESGFALFTDKPTADIFGTNFGAGIIEALNAASLATNPNIVVVFLSDGINNTGPHVNTLLPADDVVFHTFAIGAGSSCSADPSGLGSLQDIADLTCGTCTEVADPTELPEILPELVKSTLVSLEISVDGGPATPIDNANIDPDLPQNGPISVSYSVPVNDLGPGVHTICVTASGTDAGGSGTVTDCKEITVVQSVGIDIKPYSYPNSINANDKGVIPVAVFGNEAFDVSTIDPATVKFGPTGTEASVRLLPNGKLQYSMKDVNWDGYMDVVFFFLTQDTGFMEGDIMGILTGMTYTGDPIAGWDSVRIIVNK